ncbi:hypothetical protein MKW92_018778, partial [Papaver armeniacum]
MQKKTDNGSKVCHLVFISYLLLTSSCQRLSTDEIEQGGEVPLIPSLPISADDGELILRSLDGQVAKDDRQGDSNAPVYRVGLVARRLGKMQKSGWRPRRTIIFFATPRLEELLKEVAQQFGRLGGGGSDYAPFVQHVGVYAIDMLFGGGILPLLLFHIFQTNASNAGYPVYHSMYDDFTWMRKFGDPMFQRHVATASIWGLVSLRLADDEFLPFNYLSYANELQTSTKELEDQILGKSVSLLPLYKSIQELKKAAVKIDKQKKVLEDRKGWASPWRRYPLKAREFNDRLMMAERAFTDRDGLPGREGR